MNQPKSGTKKRRKKSKAPPTSKPPPTRFSMQFASPQELEVIGPLAIAQLSVPRALADQRMRAGRVVAAPITGYMLIDTGASCTCIAEETALALELPVIDVGTTYGAGGKHDLNIYPVFMALRIEDGKTGMVSEISNEIRASGIPELGNQLNHLVVTNPKVPMIGLIGRDLLRHATLIYRGSQGNVTLEFDLNSFKT